MSRSAILCVLILSFARPEFLSAQMSDRSYTLEEVLTIAEARNPSVALFQANFESARGGLRSAQSYPNPEWETSLGKGKALEADARYESEYSLGISQILEWPGKRLYRKKAAEAELAVAGEDLQDFRLELISQVKEAFFGVLFSERIAQVLAENERTAEEMVRSTQMRVESGEASALELIKAQVEFLRIIKDRRRSESHVILAKATLNAVLGGALKEGYRVKGEFARSDKRYDLAALIESAQGRHPLIQRQRKAVEAADDALSRERQARVPDLILRGSVTEEIDKRSFAIGLAIPFPLFYQRQGEISQAQGRRAQAVAELERARLDLTKRITEAYQEYRMAQAQLELLEQGLLRAADEALKIARLSYAEGESDLLNLLDSQRAQRSVVVEYQQAQFELQVALARLERAAGGLP